ncbi:MAG: enoyl-[acyl-carrier-protein] reductase FabK [Anaerovoracaceae bacterium]|nr:enoyl-[acyl-carrier-protein] reductase FabK [Clostridiales bacterium]
MNRVTELLNIEYPIIQGAMARIADSSLAAAVSNGGGLGIIASGGESKEWLSNEIDKVRTLTDKPFGVNLMLLSPNLEELIEVIFEKKVRIVTTGAGNPGKYIKALKEHNIIVVPVIASVALGIRVERAGADMVVGEGLEAGGHIGDITTMALIPQLKDAVSIPVVAAGGIGDGRGVAAAFMLGAEGVQVGTRFVVAEECTVHESYKQAIIKAKDSDTVATGRSTGHPVRVLKNRLSKEVLTMEKNMTDPNEIAELCTGRLYDAVKKGDMEMGSVMSGQIAGLVKQIQPAKEIIREMFKEAKEVYESNSAFFRTGGSISGDGPKSL